MYIRRILLVFDHIMLLKSFQTSKFLSKSGFKPVPSDANKRRLWLSSTHAVQATLGGREKGGQAEVWYGIEVDSRHTDPTRDLTINRLVPPCGSQSLTSTIDILNSMGAKMLVSGREDGHLTFDFRSLCYVCGFVSAASSVGNKVTMPDAATIVPLSTAHTVHVGSVPIVSGSLYSNGDQLATLCRLMKCSGAETFTVMDQSVYKKGGVLTGESLGVYALKVFATIVAEATEISSASAHVEAFFSGLSAVYRVLGHSFEGGGMRRVLRTRSYPAPQGILRSHAQTVLSLSTVGLLKPTELIKYNVSFVLECFGRVSRCDPCRVEGLPTIYTTDGSGLPSSLKGFESDVYTLMAEWRKKTAKEMALVSDTVRDTSSFRDYFNADEVDAHFKHKAIIPFYVIEPGPVSYSMDSSIKMLGCQGVGVELPLLPGFKGYKTAAYQEFKGRTFPGSVVKLVSESGYQARSAGINYLMSGRYARENGLSQFSMSTAPQLGCHMTRLAMSDSGARNLADARWHTYHNPLPNPGENFTNYPVALDFTYSGSPNEAGLSELVSSSVASMFGPLIVGDAPSKKSSYHRDIPPELESLVAETNGMFTFLASKSTAIDMSSLVEAPIAISPVTFTPPQPVHVPVTTEVSSDIEEEGEELDPESIGPIGDNEVDPGSTTVRPKTDYASAADTVGAGAP